MGVSEQLEAGPDQREQEDTRLLMEWEARWNWDKAQRFLKLWRGTVTR